MIEITEALLDKIIAEAHIIGALLGFLLGIIFFAVVVISQKYKDFRIFKEQYYKLMEMKLDSNTKIFEPFDTLEEAVNDIKTATEVLSVRYNLRIFRSTYNNLVSLYAYLAKHLQND